MTILSNQKKWIRACEETLQEYKNNCHIYRMSKCKLCILMTENKTNCIFGNCIKSHVGLCTIHKTFTRTDKGKNEQKRIRFYEILIPILKSLNKREFHKQSEFKRVTEICQEIDELVHETFKNRVYINKIR